MNRVFDQDFFGVPRDRGAELSHRTATSLQRLIDEIAQNENERLYCTSLTVGFGSFMLNSSIGTENTNRLISVMIGALPTTEPKPELTGLEVRAKRGLDG